MGSNPLVENGTNSSEYPTFPWCCRGVGVRQQQVARAMSDCKGKVPVTAKVNAEMRDLLDEDAEALGVYRAEVARQAFDTYRDLREGDFHCPHCSNAVSIEP